MTGLAVNMLLSYAFHDRIDLAQQRATMPCGRIMIDSGAFTAHSTGKKITLDGYASFLQEWAGSWDTAVTLDVIGDPKATRANTRKLHARGLNVMPVFTRGDKLADFDAMVRDSGYVCVGGGVGMPAKVAVPRLAGLQRRALELGGGIHALGVASVQQLDVIRPFSADASTVSGAFVYAKVVYYTGREIRQPRVSDRDRLWADRAHVQAHGIKLTGLLKTGRMPGKQERAALMRAMNLAFVCADEDMTRWDVPAPPGVEDTPGTHLYSAAVGGYVVDAVTGLDRLLHDPGYTPAPIWNRHRDRHTHQCRASRKDVVA